MKKTFIIIIVAFFFLGCSTNNQLIYLNDSDVKTYNIVDYSALQNNVEVGDILKIDVNTVVPEAVIPYNNFNSNKAISQTENIIKLEGYLVNSLMKINFPVLGEVSVKNLSLYQLENKIAKLLSEGGHLTNPSVKVRRVNSKFTILGEVSNPGTFSYFDETLNIFQAIGFAGDLTIDAKRKDITLIREKSGIRAIHQISLSKTDLLEKPYYYIYNNDVIIVKPNFRKVKSAGFIGNPSSIASITSLILSVTLLILNR